MHGAGVVLVLVVGAFLLRTVLVVILRWKAPRYVSIVERWWVWLPLAVICVAVTLWRPIVGLVVIGVTAVLVSRDDRIDVPWRNLDGPGRWRR
jgi:hypothetical protein